MHIDNLLSRLEKVRKTGASSWLACCPAHDDRNPSLSIREADEGRILVHCFSGCDVWDIVSAISLEMDALFPPTDAAKHSSGSIRRPFPAADVLQAIAFEALVVSTAASAVLQGQPLSHSDRERLTLAVSRIQSAVDAATPKFIRRAYG